MKKDGELLVKALAAIAVILIASNALLWADLTSFKNAVENKPPTIISVSQPVYSTPAPVVPTPTPRAMDDTLNASEDPLYSLYSGSPKYAQFVSVCPQYGIDKTLLSQEQTAALANETPVVYGGLEQANYPLTQVTLSCVEGPYQLLMVIDAAQGELLKEFIIERMRMG